MQHSILYASLFSVASKRDCGALEENSYDERLFNDLSNVQISHGENGECLLQVNLSAQSSGRMRK